MKIQNSFIYIYPAHKSNILLERDPIGLDGTAIGTSIGKSSFSQVNCTISSLVDSSQGIDILDGRFLVVGGD